MKTKIYLLIAALCLFLPLSLKAELGESCEQEREQIDKHLETFDDLDFNAFSKQDWKRFELSHHKDIVVYWPDGHSTKGLEKHIEDMKYMFSYAPDTRITEHSVKIGQGDWTSVMGVMEGTFSKPMKMPDGTVIQPTGKKFKLNMNTLGHWENGLMTEEYLFWDNHAFMQQIGIAK